MQQPHNDLITKIESDDFYTSFLQHHVKPPLHQSLTIAEQVKKLGEGIELINKELQRNVLEKHNDLLRQGNHATKLEAVLNTMNSHIQNLFANAERLKTQINGPYNSFEMHTKVLSRLHLASHILRQVNRIQQLSKRLLNTNDPVQKAVTLYELEQLTSDPDLTEIDAVTAELRNIRAQQQKVVKLATGSLNQGIVNENGSQTTTALQIFVNLGTVKATVDSTIECSLNECKESLKAALQYTNVTTSAKSSKGPGRANIAGSQGFRTKIWTELEKIFGEEIYQQCRQVKFLQNTLNGLTTHNIDDNVAAIFWTKLGTVIEHEIKSSSSAIQQMLEEDYPKLLKYYYEMYEKLKYKHFVFNRQVLEKCENSYLATSLTRMLDPTQAMFSNDTEVPSQAQMDSVIRVMTNELSVALIEENLSNKMCKNVSKCIKMFAVKTEQQIETGPEAAQVIGGNANLEQQRNIQYANSLFYFQVQIQRMMSNMKESLRETGLNTINESLQALTNLVSVILQPLITSINSAIETIIVTIHLESDWTRLHVPHGLGSVPCSPYMRELGQFIMRVFNTYLSQFDNKEVLTAKCSEVAIRCVELLVRHSALLRPLSQGGRIRLQADYAHLEHSLKVFYPHLEDLGRPYRLLKSMASLVALTPEEIVASQASASSVPHSTVLLLLFSFAGPELASPHQNTGWSLPKLSAWLDEHPSESDRLDLIAGALQRYEGLVRQSNSEKYDSVYPIMSQLLENCVKMLK